LIVSNLEWIKPITEGVELVIMTDFERALVNSFNQFFAEEGIEGIAHRKKQHRFSSQLCDVLVDSPHDTFYLAIENKSVKTSSSNKLYFSQHFSKSENGHQVERIKDFIERSGRQGYLAVELKRGRGKSRKAYMVPWSEVWRKYSEDESGIHLDELMEHPEVSRISGEYNFSDNLVEIFT
jgi:Holliday junction resolvase